MDIKEIYDRRHGMSVAAGSTRLTPLAEPERRAIHDWIREQHTAVAPDTAVWSMLLTSDCMLGHEVGNFLATMAEKRRNIWYASSPVKLLDQELVDWYKYPRAIKFMLAALNQGGVCLFDSNYPVIISAPGSTHVSQEQAQDIMDMMVKLQQLRTEDVLNVMLRSWSWRRAKADQARERLCDIGIRCLTLAAKPLG